MLSGRLVRLIESHWETIISSVISRLRLEPEAEHYSACVEPELREWGRILLQNLGQWLTAGKEDEIAARYEHLGRLRFEAGIPAHESVHVLCAVRERVLDFVEEQVYSKTSLELYQQEELDRRLGRFFDVLTIRMVKGYEAALRASFTAPAAAAGWRGSHG
jgi:hypothetical protein